MAEDAPDSLEKRLSNRPAHLARLQQLQSEGRLLLAGPFPAIDNVDPVVTIIVGGDLVKTSVAGTYRRTYNATDIAGNKAVEVVRIINVTVPKFIFTKVLKLGSSGTDVKELQKRLKAEGFYKWLITSYFGLPTRAALIAYQKKNNLPQTGILDAATMAVLNK